MQVVMSINAHKTRRGSRNVYEYNYKSQLNKSLGTKEYVDVVIFVKV